MNIKNYHAHLYYDESNINEARSVAEALTQHYQVPIGRFHQKPVGPHPAWSCQITISQELFGEIIPWLLMNHGSVDLFIHPNTGNDLLDHSERVMWIGRSYELNLELFQS